MSPQTGAEIHIA